jgi:hypothetical protein
VSAARRPTPHAGGLVAAAFARIEDFLLEPAEPGPAPVEPGAVGAEPAMGEGVGPRPVIAVFGLARRCGATTVARALASELAARDPGGTAAVASAEGPGALPLATPAARRLAEALADVPGATTSAVGRLCLVEGAERLALAECARHLAPLVLESRGIEVGGEEIRADRLLIVTSPRVERALEGAAVACLQRAGAEPVLVRNMVRANQGEGVAATALPHSRAGAQLALGGRQPRGELGRGVAALADLCELPA